MRRSLRSDERGLSTVEYVIVLVVVGLVAIAAWRSMGSETASRAIEARQEVSGLEQGVDGPAGARGGGSRASTRGRSRVEDATAEEAPPPSAQEELFGPVMLLGGAAILVLALVARRMLRKGDGGGQGGGGATA
jgi:hypothetical protein